MSGKRGDVSVGLDKVADVEVARRRAPHVLVLALAVVLAVSDERVAVFVRHVGVGNLRTDVHG